MTNKLLTVLAISFIVFMSGCESNSSQNNKRGECEYTDSYGNQLSKLQCYLIKREEINRRNYMR